MNLPALLSAAAIRAIPTADTHAVRVLMTSTSGSTQFVLRGMGRRKGKYILERNGATGRHILDIPVSLWNQGIPEGRYQDNPSIAHDLLSKPQPLNPFVTMIVPWTGAIATTPEEKSGAVGSLDAATVILGYFRHIKAPDHVTDLVKEIAANPHEFLHYLEEPNDDEDLDADTTLPADQVSTQEPSTPAAPVVAETSPPAPPEKAKSETAAAIRMREKRARDKAAREAEKQNLQPA